MVIDSHHHLWKYSPDQYGWITEDKGVLKRDFWLKDLSELAAENGVDGFVTVQARQSLEETDTLLGLAEELPLIRGSRRLGGLPVERNRISTGKVRERLQAQGAPSRRSR